MPNSPMWVAKIGGSLHAQPCLTDWLAGLRDDRHHRWVLVPGGGPHADAVRAEQRALGYDDAEAHRRAIHAMARYGADLLARTPGYVRLDSIAACLAHAQAGGRAPGLWCPGADDWVALAALPADWRVSADAIAHAVATRIGAAGLLLVKSIAPPRGLDAAGLAEVGWIDRWLPRLMADSHLPVCWAAADTMRFPCEAADWPAQGGRLTI